MFLLVGERRLAQGFVGCSLSLRTVDNYDFTLTEEGGGHTVFLLVLGGWEL